MSSHPSEKANGHPLPRLSLANGTHLTTDEAWDIVNRRDGRFDGAFVYAVRTTGIYCRPTCPSRRPLRQNVAFYPAPEEAQAAGFRPCRRCDPADAAGTQARQVVEQARTYLDEHLDEQVTLQVLADLVSMSSSHLQRTFKQIVGLSPRQYQEARRFEQFKQQVGAAKNVLEATFEAGFGSSRALYEQAGSKLGMTPGTYRRGGAGLAIRFTCLASALGRLLVAVTEQGVCAVLLGDEDTALEKELRQEFPNATIERAGGELHPWVEPIVRYLDGAHTHPAVPVALEGTDFQRRVWATLQQIPYGETRSYARVAEMMDRPSAARAVAGACAANRLALVVPCHRVVRADGTSGGYRWGPQRKQRLLQQEQSLNSRD